MQDNPSRKEVREAKFYTLAEEGKLKCSNLYLFKREAGTLERKHGFAVNRYGTDDKKALPSVVDWKMPFKNGVPLVVLNYINGTIKTFPNTAIENFAQELYVIAQRANYKKQYNTTSAPQQDIE